jgi:hypothetical protein
VVEIVAAESGIGVGEEALGGEPTKVPNGIVPECFLNAAFFVGGFLVFQGGRMLGGLLDPTFFVERERLFEAADFGQREGVFGEDGGHGLPVGFLKGFEMSPCGFGFDGGMLATLGAGEELGFGGGGLFVDGSQRGEFRLGMAKGGPKRREALRVVAAL